MANKFNEDIILDKLKKYIDFTYEQHYGKGKIQTTEVTFDAGHGESFCIGNILKYAQTFDKEEGKNEADLYNSIHYAIMRLGQMDKEENEKLKEFKENMKEGAEAW